MRWRTRLAWAGFLTTVVAVVAATALGIANGFAYASPMDHGFGLVAITLAGVGVFIASRRPTHAIGWLLLGIGASIGLVTAAAGYASYALITHGSAPGGIWAAWLSDWLWVLGVGPMLGLFPLLFPDGSPPSPGWRRFGWAFAAYIAFAAIAFALDPVILLDRPADVGGPIELGSPIGSELFGPIAEWAEGPGTSVLLVAALASFASLVQRYRRANLEVRAQIRWVALATAAMVTAFTISTLLDLMGVEGAAEGPASQLVFLVILLGFPVSAAVAIAKYRLYDIDLVISKALLFGLLAAFVTTVYLTFVIGVGALIGRRGNVLLSILATAVVAVAFQPMRERARRLANRIVYGKRATPYEVLSEFSERVGDTYSADDVLPRMAQLVVEATGAKRSDVWLRVGNELRVEASWPPEAAPRRPRPIEHPWMLDDIEHVTEVRHRGEVLGLITLEPSPDDPIDAAKEGLVHDLASQAGLVLRNVRLIEELRASRQRLVTAQDEERRKLERNLHDGAQQQLVALAVQLKLARTLVDRDTAKAAGMLDALQTSASEALEDLRNLARGIYPPLLADQGLAAALDSQARKAALPVTVEADGIGRYSQGIESAVYFSCLEALNNVAKYARASSAYVILRERDGALTFDVSDDGAGFDVSSTSYGTGLQGIADRLEAIGGELEVRSTPGAGTTIHGSVRTSEMA